MPLDQSVNPAPRNSLGFAPPNKVQTKWGVGTSILPGSVHTELSGWTKLDDGRIVDPSGNLSTQDALNAAIAKYQAANNSSLWTDVFRPTLETGAAVTGAALGADALLGSSAAVGADTAAGAADTGAVAGAADTGAGAANFTLPASSSPLDIAGAGSTGFTLPASTDVTDIAGSASTGFQLPADAISMGGAGSNIDWGNLLKTYGSKLVNALVGNGQSPQGQSPAQQMVGGGGPTNSSPLLTSDPNIAASFINPNSANQQQGYSPYSPENYGFSQNMNQMRQQALAQALMPQQGGPYG